MKELLDNYLVELLHINDINKNSLLKIDATPNKTIEISSSFGAVHTHLINIIKERLGKTANTLLKDSSPTTQGEQRIGKDLNVLDWKFLNGTKDYVTLDKFIDEAYKNLTSKGNNILFLSIGTFNWMVPYDDGMVEISSPILIFPIKLVRTGASSPVYIEFIDDDINFNPCLYYKLKENVSADVLKELPHPMGKVDFDTPIEINKITPEYLDNLVDFAASNRQSTETVFNVKLDKAYISTYNHDEICMYYDLKRNKEKLLNHEIVNKMYLNVDGLISYDKSKNDNVSFVLPYDSTQEEIIRDVVNTKSLIIKGPPGSGKTLTIANMISSLLANGKKVLFSSKKESAMTEVYAKLPKEIRDFALLLDAESEASAVNISATSIKKELKRVIQEKEGYRNHSNIKDINILLNNYSREVEKLIKYYSFVFDKNLIEDSYFNIINNYLEYESLEELDVIEEKNALAYNKEMFDYLVNEFSETQNIFSNLTKDNKYPLNKNPYYYLKDNIDTDDLYNKFNKIKDSLIELINIINSKIENINSLTLDSLIWFLGDKLPDEDLKLLYNSKILKDNKDNLLNKLIKYLKIKEKENKLDKDIDIPLFDLMAQLDKTKELKINEEINNKDLDLIFNNISIFEDDKHFLKEEKDILSLVNSFKEINEINEKIDLLLFNSRAVYKKELTKEDIDFIIESNEIIKPFVKDNKKIGAFAFKAKKALDKLKTLSYLKDPTLEELYKGSCDLKEVKELDGKIKFILSGLERILHQNITEEKQETLNTTFKYVSSDVMVFITDIKKNYKFITETASKLGLKEYKLKDLKETLNDLVIIKELDELILDIKDEVGLSSSFNNEIIAKNGLGILYLNSNLDDTLIAIKHIRENRNKILPIINNVKNMFDDIKDYFEMNCYVFKNLELSFEEIKIFNDLVSNKNAIGDFYKLKAKTNNKELNTLVHYTKFVKRYLDNLDYVVNKKNEILNIFKHSFYNKLLKGKILTASNPSAVTFDIVNSAKKLHEINNELMGQYCLSIQDKLMSFINPNDPAFLGLSSERGTKNLRLLFKEEKDLILKMKRCIILSPSTASALMRAEEFSHFDVVIIDEASQMLPVEMLPLLFRAKQAIIVGDEWQMPPISHFKIKGPEGYKTEDEDFILNKEDSALALALKSKSFDTRELKSHYRSKTESLIKFSQERFYPYMQTFPAIQPKTDELGIEDIYVPDGYCISGQNEKEAILVVEKLVEHFNKYYNPDKVELSSSVGVVAFGEAQLKLIEAYVRKNTDLFNKCAKLEAKLGNVKEKTIFFKTIEKVQGQEADKLILSLTYGKDRNDRIIQMMGEMNKSYGECIFNVAVTRAKNMITVIHSVKPEELTNPNIAFIRQYLLITRELSNYGKNQFLSENPTPFMLSIGKYLETLGISKDRIVYGYGVTKGSVRIPIVILSDDLKRAMFGIWAEKDIKVSSYIDINSRYYQVLLGNGWNLYNILAHDWYYNNNGEKEKLENYYNNIRKKF